jgi:hypothetical protein
VRFYRPPLPDTQFASLALTVRWSLPPLPPGRAASPQRASHLAAGPPNSVPPSSAWLNPGSSSSSVAGASGRIAPRRRMRESGIVAGEDLSPRKAPIPLMLALSTTNGIGEIQQAFQTYQGPPISGHIERNINRYELSR